VRELEHLIERAAVKAGGRAITAEQIQEELTRAKSPAADAFDTQGAIGMPFHEAVASWERYLIEQALKASNGNKSDAARRLQIHRRLLYEKLAQLGMIWPTQLAEAGCLCLGEYHAGTQVAHSHSKTYPLLRIEFCRGLHAQR
jgi:DNA-binding NtrC family response regulator